MFLYIEVIYMVHNYEFMIFISCIERIVIPGVRCVRGESEEFLYQTSAAIAASAECFSVCFLVVQAECLHLVLSVCGPFSHRFIPVSVPC